jgi:hypothetical protein
LQFGAGNLVLLSLLTSCVADTSGKWPPELFIYWWQFATSVFDTGGKFVDYVTAIKVNLGKDMSTKLPTPISTTPAVNLPQVSLISTVHLELRISCEFSKKVLKKRS